MAGSICSACMQGSLHEGETKGTIKTIHGYETYVATPHPHPSNPPKNTIVVVIPDAFGWATSNMRLLADRYATRMGCPVYVPDFMNNYPMPLWLMTFPIDDLVQNWSLTGILWKPYYFFWALYGAVPFLSKNNVIKARPRVLEWFAKLRQNEGQTNLIGAAGFCWGGNHAFEVSGRDAKTESGEYLIDFAFTGHPSALTVKQVEAVDCPMSVAMGTADFVVKKKFAEEMREILRKKEGRAKGSDLEFYEGGNHGFACRADLKNDAMKECADRAEDQAVRWVAEMIERLNKK